METGSKMERLARGETNERVDMREALRWVNDFVDVAITYVPLDAQEAFLADVDARLGMSPARPSDARVFCTHGNVPERRAVARKRIRTKQGQDRTG
jgi:hypothetical protein